MTASARWRRRGVPPAPQASAAVGTPRALWPIGSAGADKERSAAAGFSGGREVGVSSPGAPSSSWTETRPRRPLLQPVNRVERGDRAAIPASPPACRPGFFRSLASSGGSPAIRVPRPYRSRLQQHRDHSHTRCPLLPARCPHRWRAPGAQSSPACAPPPQRPLPCPHPHKPMRGVAAPTDPPKPTPCRAPPSPGVHSSSRPTQISATRAPDSFKLPSAAPRKRTTNHSVPASKTPAAPPPPPPRGQRVPTVLSIRFSRASGPTQSQTPGAPWRAPAGVEVSTSSPPGRTARLRRPEFPKSASGVSSPPTH